jgi:hypothetical protein
VGGAFPANQGGGPTPATKPGVPMVVDYVQVQYHGGGVSPTTTPPMSTSTTAIPTTHTTVPTTARTTPPGGTGPSNLAVTSYTASTITLGWKGNAAASYDILRSGVRIATVTGLKFTDIGLNKNTPYLYSVRGTGGTTPVLTVTIPASGTPTSSQSTSPTSAGSQPSDLHVKATTASTITLAWTGSGTGRYDVLRSGIRIATVTGASFTDIGLNRQTPYLYSIRGGSVTTPQIQVIIP